MFKLSAGNAGNLVNSCILSGDPQGCPRRIFLRNQKPKIEEPIGPDTEITFDIGKMMENIFAKRHPWCKMNVRMPEMLPITKNTVLGLECDSMDVERKLIWELKTVSSTSKLKDFIVKGGYKYDNALQLAYYTLAFNNDDQQIDKGILRYTSVIYDKFTVNKVEHKMRPGAHRDFECEWKGETFYVENKPTRITVKGITRFCEYIAHVLEDQPPLYETLKPVDEECKNTACYWCYWKACCNEVDARRETWDVFKAICEQKVEADSVQ